MLPGAGFEGASVICQIRLKSWVKSRPVVFDGWEYPDNPAETSMRTGISKQRLITMSYSCAAGFEASFRVKRNGFSKPLQYNSR